MGLLEIVEKHVEMRKVGGEWHGACPECGCGPDGPAVSDRFTVKADERWFCRNCGNGDTVSFLRKFEHMSCPDAHAAAGKVCTSTTCPVNDKCRMGNGVAPPQKSRFATPDSMSAVRAAAPFVPGEAVSPAEIWQGKAEALVTAAHAALLTSSEVLAYLADRGLPLGAVVKNRLGWNSAVIYKSRASWGLPESRNPETGKPRKLWIPRGIVIPTYLDGVIHRIRIRVPKEDRNAKVPGYVAVTGSGDDIVSLNPTALAFATVEADLDAMLIDWVAGDIVGAVALVSADVKPKKTLATLLDVALCILVATDYDPKENTKTGKYENPGGKAALWWLKTYPRAKRWPVPIGKDPGDAYQAGVNVREWIISGLPTSLRLRSQVSVPAATSEEKKETAVKFDRDRAWHRIKEARSEIASSCPSGALEWLQGQLEISGYLNRAEAAVDQAFLAENEDRLIQVLEKWVEGHVRAWNKFVGLPPVVEVPVAGGAE
jgi:DNA primase